MSREVSFSTVLNDGAGYPFLINLYTLINPILVVEHAEIKDGESTAQPLFSIFFPCSGKRGAQGQPDKIMLQYYRMHKEYISIIKTPLFYRSGQKQ